MAVKPDELAVTEDQVSLWLANPVTIAFFHAIHQRRDDLVNEAGSGSVLVAGNADQTQANMFTITGCQTGLMEAAGPIALLDRYELIFRPEQKEENE